MLCNHHANFQHTTKYSVNILKNQIHTFYIFKNFNETIIYQIFYQILQSYQAFLIILAQGTLILFSFMIEYKIFVLLKFIVLVGVNIM